jgi:hypothetical protein
VVVKTVRYEHKKQKEAIEKEKPSKDDMDIEIPDEAESWRSILHCVLIQDMSPNSFERLAKRILGESCLYKLKSLAVPGMVALTAKA